jgi:hypothetical protein
VGNIMIVQVIFAFALFSSALSCNGGVGVGDSILQNPTFSFAFNPPISWTWYMQNTTTFAYPEQAISQSDAVRNMNNSINAAILSATQKLGISTIGMSWTISGFNPQSMYIVDDLQVGTNVNLAGSYIPGLGAVLYKRGTYDATTKYPRLDYVEHLTINVRSTGLYFKSQWQTLSDRVFNYLSIYEKVKFRSPVTII